MPEPESKLTPRTSRFHARRHTLGGRPVEKKVEFCTPPKSYESPTILRRSLDSPTQRRKDPVSIVVVRLGICQVDGSSIEITKMNPA
jgi:hypothetical protein